MSKKSEQTLAFAKVTDTLGECLEKMKEKDVLSLPILDLEKKTTKDSFHGFVSVESCLRVFLENMAVFLVGRKQEPFCVSSHESSSANPRVMPPMIEELGLQPGDVSRFGCQYGGDVPAKKNERGRGRSHREYVSRDGAKRARSPDGESEIENRGERFGNPFIDFEGKDREDSKSAQVSRRAFRWDESRETRRVELHGYCEISKRER